MIVLWRLTRYLQLGTDQWRHWDFEVAFESHFPDRELFSRDRLPVSTISTNDLRNETRQYNLGAFLVVIRSPHEALAFELH